MELTQVVTQIAKKKIIKFAIISCITVCSLHVALVQSERTIRVFKLLRVF